jgi:hypothetical protein
LQLSTLLSVAAEDGLALTLNVAAPKAGASSAHSKRFAPQAAAMTFAARDAGRFAVVL